MLMSQQHRSSPENRQGESIHKSCKQWFRLPPSTHICGIVQIQAVLLVTWRGRGDRAYGIVTQSGVQHAPTHVSFPKKRLQETGLFHWDCYIFRCLGLIHLLIQNIFSMSKLAFLLVKYYNVYCNCFEKSYEGLGVGSIPFHGKPH